MDNMLSLQINEVKADFEYSLSSVKHKHNGPLFDYIRGTISHYSLDLIKKENDKSNAIGFDAAECDHVLRTVYGLLCAHELAQYNHEDVSIPIKSVNEHWSKLTIVPNETSDIDIDRKTEMIMFKKLYLQSTEDEKIVLMRKLKEMATPTTTSLKEPRPVVPKGRPPGSKRKLTQKEMKHEKSTKRDPSGFEYAMTVKEQKLKKKVPDKLPQTSKSKKGLLEKKVDLPKYNLIRFLPFIKDFMHPFIADFKDVKPDGNCGFRCIAEHFGWNDSDGWIQVRGDLLVDLEKHKNKYCEHFGNWFYEENKKILECFDSPCNHNFWMQMSDMGYLIASAYNCVVVHLSLTMNMTFVPHDEPILDEKIQIISIAHVENNHFVRVILMYDAPIPPIASMWERLVTREASIWRDEYSHEIAKYISLRPKTYDNFDSPITIS